MTATLVGATSACPALCGRPVKPGYVTCAPCWRQVPDELRRRVTQEWHAWQRNPADPAARARYQVALDEAVAAIAAIPRQRRRIP